MIGAASANTSMGKLLDLLKRINKMILTLDRNKSNLLSVPYLDMNHQMKLYSEKESQTITHFPWDFNHLVTSGDILEAV